MARRTTAKLRRWCDGKAKARLIVEQRSNVSRRMKIPKDPMVQQKEGTMRYGRQEKVEGSEKKGAKCFQK